MKTRIKYKTNGLGKTLYYPQRKILWFWRTYREYKRYSQVLTLVEFDKLEETRNFIVNKFIINLRNTTAKKGIIT